MISTEAAAKWGISKRQVNILCSGGKIPGAVLREGRWEIPDGFVYESKKRQTAKRSVSPSTKYYNPGNEGFSTIRNSEYVDKSGMISFMNSWLDTPQKLICVSRPRRFGKSFGAKMLSAYYSKSCDSIELFRDLTIAKDPSFKAHLNKHSVKDRETEKEVDFKRKGKN